MNNLVRYGSKACLAAALLVNSFAFGAGLVVPNYCTDTQIHASGGEFNSVTREQTVYNASEFPTGPITITEIRWRPDQDAGRPISTTLSNLQIHLSTTLANADQLSGTFAENVGADDAVVFNGVFHLSTAFITESNGTTVFDISLPLQTPFTYDPSKGNLLMDFRNFNGCTPNEGNFLNVAGAAGDATSRVYAFDPNATNATVADTGGGVLQIIYTVASISNTAPVITRQPTNLTVSVGGTAKFSTTATGSPTLFYQWYGPASTFIPGANGSTLTLSNVQSGQAGSYFVLVTNSFGFALSSNAVLTVSGGVSNTAPVITKQPTNQTVSAGGTASFSVTVTGSPTLQYQWVGPGTNEVVGGTNAILTLSNVQPSSAGVYYVVVFNSAGYALSSNAVLTVNGGGGGTFTNGLVIPNYLATNQSSVPNGTLNEIERAQTVYSASQFPPTPITITEIRWRPDVITGGPLSLTISNLQIHLSTTKTNVDNLSATFAQNIGADDAAVFNGTAHLSTAFITNSDGTTAFDLSLPLQTPFIYDSTKGNLLVDLYNFSGSTPAHGNFVNGTESFTDAVSRAVSLDANAPNALFVDSGGDVLKIIYTSGVISSNTAPVITKQPTNQTVSAGGTATFSVTATGSPTLHYQWYGPGSSRILGAVNPTLTLSNVQPSQAGAYFAFVTNLFGFAQSSNAVLTVTGGGGSNTCTPPPSGISAWWPGEGNGNDIVGGNTAFGTPDVNYYAGEVGQAFWLNNSNAYLTAIAASNVNVGAGGSFSVEAWVALTDVKDYHPIVEWNNNSGSVGVHLWVLPFNNQTGVLFANVVGTDGNSHSFTSPAGSITTNGFQHVALTYDQGTGVGTLYVNGSSVAQATLGSFTPQTSYAIWLGHRPGDVVGNITLGSYLGGLLDELSLYRRALSASEIAAIYNAGTNGKCAVTAPFPVITKQPTNQTVSAGGTATFSVTVTGSPTLHYQWYGPRSSLILGAVNPTLTLSNVQPSQAGAYFAFVTNLFGFAQSSNAVLTVNGGGGGGGTFTNGLVVPNYLATNQSSVPNGTLNEVGRVQQVYGASQFPAAPITITEIRWRPDVFTGGPLSLTISNLQIHLSNTAKNVDGLSATLAQNVGSNDAVVFNGTAHLSTAFTTNSDGTTAFDLSLPLQTPFVYDSTKGNLLVDLFNFSGCTPAHGNFDNGTESFTDAVSRTVSFDPNATTASFVDSGGDVLEIIYTSGSSASNTTPVITKQPTNQTVAVGGTATFSVTATGSPTLHYQWYGPGSALILGANNSTLTLSNVQPSSAGAYFVFVTNLFGFAQSSNAVLTVNGGGGGSSNTCTPPASGLVGWWKGEGNALDSAGTNNGVLMNGVGFATGEVGQGFLFTQTNQNVKIAVNSNLNVGLGGGLTVEAWINPVNLSQYNPIMEWNADDTVSYFGVHLYVIPLGPAFGNQPGNLYADVQGSDDSWHQLWSSGQTVVSNQFQHVALTYDKASGVARLYRNGVVVAENNFGNFTPKTIGALNIGCRPTSPANEHYAFAGVIDEPSVYNRALSSSEIAAIYSAGSNGKCSGTTSNTVPVLTKQPTNQTVSAGGTATFSVTATGSTTLQYQWIGPGTNEVVGGTNATLTLSNVQPSSAGVYYVVVFNSSDYAVSSNAVLTVNGGGGGGTFTNGLVIPNYLATNQNNVPDGTLNEVGRVQQVYAASQFPPAPITITEIRWRSDVITGGPLSLTISNLQIHLSTTKTNVDNLSATFAQNIGADDAAVFNGTAHLSTASTTNSDGTTAFDLSLPLQTPFVYDSTKGNLLVDLHNISGCTPAHGNFVNGTESFTDAVSRAVSFDPNSASASFVDSGGDVLEIIYTSGGSTSNTAPVITKQPTNQTVAVGGTATLSVTATGSPTLHYQWYGPGSSLILGAVNPTLTLSNVQPSQAGAYFAFVTNLFGFAQSSNAVLTVTGGSGGGGSSNGLVVPNYSATNQIHASGGEFNSVTREQMVYNASEFPAGPITITEIRWRPDQDAGGPISTTVSNLQIHLSTTKTNADNLSLTFAQNIGADDTVVFNGPLHINTAFITLSNGTKAFDISMPLQTPFTYDPSKGNLLMDFRNFTGCTPNEGNFLNVAGGKDATSRAYAFDPNATTATIADTGGPVLQIIYTVNGGGSTSNTAPAITQQPSNQGTLAGETATFSVTATGSAPLHYQWYGPQTNLLAGANSSTLTLNVVPPSQAGKYFVVITNAFGSVQSSNATLTVTGGGGSLAPIVFQQPTNQTVPIGGNTSFTVSVSGSGAISFQWYGPGANKIIGGTSPMLILSNVQLTNAGTYFAVITNAFGSTQSSNAVLTVTSGGGGTTPPLIIQQPSNQTLPAGLTAIFTVAATGSPTLHYQWFVGSTPIGVDNSALTLSNVQPANAGVYHVTVTNLFGSAFSSNVVLTVSGGGSTSNTCTPPPSGLVAWWKAEGNGLDSAGTNNGTLLGNLGFTNGEVGQAFNFTDTTQGVHVNASPSLAVKNLTIEAWIRPIDVSDFHPIIEYGQDTGPDPVEFLYGWNDPGGSTPGALFGIFRGTNDTTLLINSPGGILPAGQWSHVAMTFNFTNQTGTLYLNGVAVGSSVFTNGVMTPQTSLPIHIGYRPNTSGEGRAGDRFSGGLDEVSIYNRTLSASEIQAIYHAGSSGKCTSDTALAIITQPTNTTAIVGSTAKLSVAAVGTGALSYQWWKSNSIVAGAIGSTLTFSNVQFSAAGLYHVVVSDSHTSVTSSNALLTVTTPPVATVAVVTTSTIGGTTFDLPVNLIANGNENALSFTLNFDSTKLTFSSINLGNAATNGLILPNTSQASNGVIGVQLALPAGVTFNAGTQQIVRVTFSSPIVTGATQAVSVVSFSGTPVAKLLSDAQGNALPANFIAGLVLLSPTQWEGDASPVSVGNGTVDLFDWVQVGRFVAGLDTITNASEFQKVDCAPRNTLGDGKLTVADWVQAGRYAAGLDPLTLAGGPTTVAAHSLIAGADDVSSPRQITVQGGATVKGMTITLPITMVSQGDETALAFSLSFDPATLQYVSAVKGSDTASANLVVNANQSANGQVAMVLCLPSVGSHFPAGTLEIAKVTFVARASTTNNTVSFADQPVARSISDASATELSANYLGNSVIVNPQPTVGFSHAGNSSALSWPTWAGDFTLQAAGSLTPPINWTNVPMTLQTNGNNIQVILPTPDQQIFFRLSHP